MRRAYNPRGATRILIKTVNELLAQYGDIPVTLRQLFYRLVALHLLENTVSAYTGLSKKLVRARLAGMVDETRIIDRVRSVWRTSCWDDLGDFLRTVRRSYRLEKWTSQPICVEVWCEKDAVTGTLEPVTDEFEAVLFPCRGYDSYSALREATVRISNRPVGTVILYLGDFDPSGVDMPRDIRDRAWNDFDTELDLRVIALTPEQVEEYDLPPMMTKRKDTRRAGFVQKYGDRCVELDALEPPILQALVRPPCQYR